MKTMSGVKRLITGKYNNKFQYDRDFITLNVRSLVFTDLTSHKVSSYAGTYIGTASQLGRATDQYRTLRTLVSSRVP